MIDFAMTIPIDDGEIHQFPLEIISEILQQVTNKQNSTFILNIFCSVVSSARI